MDDVTGRSSRLWALLEWSFIGAGLIFTLIGLSVNGFLNFATNPSTATTHRKPIKHKRILIAGGSHSELIRAIVHRLRNEHKCTVISLRSNCNGKLMTSGPEEEEDRNSIICDLTNSKECRTQIQEVWLTQDNNCSGFDVVINCEVDESANGADVGQRVEKIGSNIQQMINLLINLVPKMIERGEGKFVLLRNCHLPNHQNGYAATSEYGDLLEQLLESGTNSSVTPPNVDLVQLYCPGQESAYEMAGRVINAIESGKSRILDLSQSDFWTFLLGKISLKAGSRAEGGNCNFDVNKMSSS